MSSLRPRRPRCRSLHGRGLSPRNYDSGRCAAQYADGNLRGDGAKGVRDPCASADREMAVSGRHQDRRVRGPVSNTIMTARNPLYITPPQLLQGGRGRDVVGVLHHQPLVRESYRLRRAAVWTDGEEGQGRGDCGERNEDHVRAIHAGVPNRKRRHHDDCKHEDRERSHKCREGAGCCRIWQPRPPGRYPR